MGHYLDLPKLHSPDFAVPGKLPLGDLKVASNSLTKGLTHLVVFNDTEAYDLVTGKQLTKGSAPSRDGDNGVLFDEVGDYYILPDVELNTECSILTHIAPTDNTGPDFQYFLSTGGFAATDAINWYINESGATDPGVLRFYADSGGLYEDVTGFISDYPEADIAVVTQPAGTSHSVYVNGVEAGNNGSSSTQIFNSTKDLYIGARSDLNSTRFYGGTVKYVAIWGDRGLSDADIFALQKDVGSWKQLIEPATSVAYFVPEGGEGPTVTPIPPKLHNSDNQFATIIAHRLGGVLS